MKTVKRLIALLLTLSFTIGLITLAPAVSSAAQATLQVAYFSINGTAAQEINSTINNWLNKNTVVADGTTITGASFTSLTAAQIAAGALSNYDLFIIGDAGGSAVNAGSAVASALGASAVTAIQNFVASGKGYVGLGGGAFVATQGYSGAQNFLKIIKYAVDYPYWNHGTGELVVVPATVSHAITSGMEEDLPYVAYADAPPVLISSSATDPRLGTPQMLLRNASNPRNNLGATANFSSGLWTNMAHTPSVASATFGSGRVAISGVLLQSSKTANLDFVLGRMALYAAGYNNITSAKKSATPVKPQIVGEWVWASEVHSLGGSGEARIASRSAEMGVTDIFLLVKGESGHVGYLKGTVPLGRSSYGGRDILQEMVDAGHAYGIRIHAWIITLVDDLYASTHSSETLCHYTGTYDSSFMNPRATNYQNYMKNMVAEIVNLYDVDGIHFDNIRYPHTAYGWSAADQTQMQQYGINVNTLKGFVDATYYSSSNDDGNLFRQHAAGYYYPSYGTDALKFAQMRCDNIAAFAQQVINAARAVKPNITMSASLMHYGAYQGNQYVSGRNDYPELGSSYGDVMYGQSYEHAAQLYDFICPMLYTGTYAGSAQWVAALTRSAAAKGNKVVAGLHAWTPNNSTNIMNEAAQIKELLPNPNVLGYCLYRYSHYAYAKSTYSWWDNMLKIKVSNAILGVTLNQVVITMQGGLTATSLHGLYGGTGATVNITGGGKTITISKSGLLEPDAELTIYLNVSGSLNQSSGRRS